MRPSEPEFITIGKIMSSWGTQGKMRVMVATDFPQRFTPSSRVHIDRKLVTLDSVEWRKGQAIIKVDTIDSIEKADELRGKLIEIHNSQLQTLPEGQYYHFQLVGLEVRTTAEELLGTITDVITTSSNDVYVVQGDKGEILIPAIDDVIESIDLNKRCLIIEPIKGLLNLNDRAAK